MPSSGNGADTQAAAEPPPEPPPASAGPPPEAQELKARLDRYGQIIAKVVNLAEAGLSLGLTVIGTVGAAAQKRLLEARVDNGVAEPAQAAAAPTVGQPAEPAEAAPSWGVTNRLPIVPGAPLGISFSINNDNPLAPRPVTLAVEAFVGERTGAPLPPGVLAVAPPSAVIAPMDFEKFVLQGALPPETPPDVYYGSLRVGDDGGMRIPVRLVVEPRGGFDA